MNMHTKQWWSSLHAYKEYKPVKILRIVVTLPYHNEHQTKKINNNKSSVKDTQQDWMFVEHKMMLSGSKTGTASCCKKWKMR